MPPVEPPGTGWVMPDPRRADPGDEVLGVGADLQPGTLLSAYRSGLFPMNLDRRGPLGWWSPDPRGVLPLDGLRVTRSLAKSCRRYAITVDTDFEGVMRACGDPRRPSGWITEEFVEAYVEMHRLGWAHSVEARDADGRLVGGLYGIEVGGLFAGESMFHHETDASKAALLGLVRLLANDPDGAAGRRLIDVQWATPHLASLGVEQVPRASYVGGLASLLAVPDADFRNLCIG